MKLTDETTYTWNVALAVKVQLTLGAERLKYRQGFRTVDLPLASVQLFGYRDRGKALLGMSSSELVLRHQAGGRVQCTKIPFDLHRPECQQALEALRRLRPGADTTTLPWPEAAARLGVPARVWYEGLLNPKATIGVVLCGAGALTGGLLSSMEPDASAPERLGRGIVVLACWIVGITLIVLGVRASRRRG